MSAEATTTTPPANRDEVLRTALSSGPRPDPPGRIAAARAFAWRGMLKIKHVPE